MNEKIKLFNEQAIKYAQESLNNIAIVNKSGIMYNYNDLYTEKFSELIVRECARTAAMFSMNKNDIHPDIKWVDMTESAKLVNHITCQQVAEKIKEHFGVEE